MTPQERRGLFEVRVGIWATEAEAAELQGVIMRTLCPDRDHQGPCPIPWEAAVDALDDFPDRYQNLAEQVAIERPSDLGTATTRTQDGDGASTAPP